MSTRVLIADDHGVLREGVRELLQISSDLRVVATARDGREAVAKAAELAPEVVVMDISMPKLSGIEATRLIVGKAPATGVVMLSMHHSLKMIGQALAAGARGYLLKASAANELLAAVRAIAAGGRYLGAGTAVSANQFSLRDAFANSAGDALTVAEHKILRLVVDGSSNAETARALGLSPRTVETYRSRMMEKLQLENLPALVKFAIRHGITGFD
jgi:DNA-binding NarL/FixJ family response regulator